MPKPCDVSKVEGSRASACFVPGLKVITDRLDRLVHLILKALKAFFPSSDTSFTSNQLSFLYLGRDLRLLEIREHDPANQLAGRKIANLRKFRNSLQFELSDSHSEITQLIFALFKSLVFSRIAR